MAVRLFLPPRNRSINYRSVETENTPSLQPVRISHILPFIKRESAQSCVTKSVYPVTASVKRHQSFLHQTSPLSTAKASHETSTTSSSTMNELASWRRISGSVGRRP